MILYIDTDDYAASGIEVFTFPGGEPHANVPVWDGNVVHIFAKIRTWADWGWLNCVGDALNSQGVSVNLFMPYLPGARQDRNTGGLTPLTCRIYAGALEWASRVTVCDPHSDNAVEIYNTYLAEPLRVVDSSLVLKDLVRRNAYDFVLCPDKGAYDRANLAAARLGIQKVLTCEKKRDFVTGNLSGFKVPHTAGGYGLLVDDICDGGGTFVGISEAFTHMPDPPTLDLYVTHGIFSKGVVAVTGYQSIYTTNSFYQEPPPAMGSRFVGAADLIPYYFGGMQP